MNWREQDQVPEADLPAGDDAAYQKLRALLLGPDYEAALDTYISREQDAERVAAVLAEAIRLSARDPALGKALAPVLNKAIQASIANNPRQITNVIFPIMGPAIRKSVGATLRDMVQSLNRVLEQSLSAQGILWRIKAWRAGVSYGRYVISQTLKYHVEQVLLVHRETGLLLHSVHDEQAHARDPELVSSMLTAIQDFVHDSFEQDEGSNLSRIDMGDFTLHCCSGPYAVLAIAVRGTISERALEEIDEACEQLHRDFGHDLAHFEGDRDAFLATEDTLRRCLLSERLEPEPDKPRKPWLALALLSAIAIGLIWQAWNTYTLAKERRQVLATIAVEQGYILLDHSYQNGVLLIEALRDHRAADESELLAKLTSPLFHVSLNTHEVTLGAITPPPPPILPEPPAPPTLQQQYLKLRQALNDSYFRFDEGAINLQADELPKLARTLESINRLLKLANELKLPRPQILLMGLADPSGSAAANIRISQQRAEALRDLLAQNGIDNNVLIAWGLGEQKAISADAALQRRVSLRVIDTMDGARPLP